MLYVSAVVGVVALVGSVGAETLALHEGVKPGCLDGAPYWKSFSHLVVIDKCLDNRLTHVCDATDGISKQVTYGPPYTGDDFECAGCGAAECADCAVEPMENPEEACYCQCDPEPEECGAARRRLGPRPPPGGDGGGELCPPPGPQPLEVGVACAKKPPMGGGGGGGEPPMCNNGCLEKYCADHDSASCDVLSGGDFDYVIVTRFPQGYGGPSDSMAHYVSGSSTDDPLESFSLFEATDECCPADVSGEPDLFCEFRWVYDDVAGTLTQTDNGSSDVGCEFKVFTDDCDTATIGTPCVQLTLVEVGGGAGRR